MNWKNETQKRVLSICNLQYGQFDGVGKYDIPYIEPLYDLPNIKKWIGFNQVLSDTNPKDKAVHFFIDDYQFERIWANPNKYIPKLRQYALVATPDFSIYGDMPLALQIYNCYRKQWIGRYFQQNGINIIPTVRCSTDVRSYDFFLDGIPKNSIILMSSMWAKKYPLEARQEYETVKAVLNPSLIIVYGNGKHMGIKDNDNVMLVKNFSSERLKVIKNGTKPKVVRLD